MSSSNNSESGVAKVTWGVVNFQNLGTGLQTKKFPIQVNDKFNFELRCYPKYNYTNFGDHTLIYLIIDNCDKTNQTFQYSMSILNGNSEKWKTQDGKVTFVKDRVHHGAHFLIFREHILEPTNKLLVDGNLKIYCEVEDITNKISENPVSNMHQDILPNKLAEDYQSLLESGKFSDASLIVAIGEKRLLVHKAILSARSKVFAAMFENDCEEKRKNRVEIIDISAEVCEQMLSYIYTGQIPDMNKYAADLFVVADKYELEHLKQVCEQYLSTKLDVESAANSLLVADMHHATVLKANSIEFIIKNGEKVIASEGWKALIKARPELGFELFERIYKKN